MSGLPRVTKHVIAQAEKAIRDSGLRPTPERVADRLIYCKFFHAAEQVLARAERSSEQSS